MAARYWTSALNSFIRTARSLSTASLALRPYQKVCLDKCIEAYSAGVSRIGASLPTGAGKTTVFISLLDRLHAPTQEATNSLVIVNSVELARQCAAQVFFSSSGLQYMF
jgi:ATP-dependent helicase IRC3